MLLLFILQTLRTCKKQEKIDNLSSVVNNLNDTVKTWKDKNGTTHAKTGVIETTDTKDFLNVKGLENENKRLQDVVRKYEKQIKNSGSVTIFNSDTKANIKVPTKIDTFKYTVRDTVLTYPVYKSDFNLDGWIIGNTIARPDSTIVNLKTHDEFSVIIGEDKKGFLGLGKPTPFAEITSASPYVEIPVSKTYKVKVNTTKGKWILPTVAGIAIGSIGTVLLIK